MRPRYVDENFHAGFGVVTIDKNADRCPVKVLSMPKLVVILPFKDSEIPATTSFTVFFTYETPGPGKSHTRECKSYQDSWDEIRRTLSAEEAKQGIVGDPNTRPLDTSESSVDPEPKGQKQLLRQTRRTWLTTWTRTTSEEDHRHFINWNQSTMKTCRRRREWQETRSSHP